MNAKQEFKVGDEITAKFKNHLNQELTVTGRIREVNNEVLCCNDLETSRPFAVNFDEVINHKVCCETLDHPEDYTSPNCKKYDLEQALKGGCDE
ncbi:hypothetical protein F889_02153 [Acinetobacter colistiniresistens]|uniref:Uncharacterized protein n=1 Tax=Acinetobacter colistiniresistens TaxID=280145 RepID=N9PJ72_9GAMM|nr:hypothetical protein [Acinetobacter colistiniresistens]ENX33493.1 hypothetical protein F889_02153 [Acinetobacter colistiniresistens]